MARWNVPRGRVSVVTEIVDVTDEFEHAKKTKGKAKVLDRAASSGVNIPRDCDARDRLMDGEHTSESTSYSECPICFEPAENAHATPCGHVFCGNCAQECAFRTNTCPVCRADDAFFPPELPPDPQPSAPPKPDPEETFVPRTFVETVVMGDTGKGKQGIFSRI